MSSPREAPHRAWICVSSSARTNLKFDNSGLNVVVCDGRLIHAQVQLEDELELDRVEIERADGEN